MRRNQNLVARSETPDMIDAILQRVRLLAARASNPKTRSAEKPKLRQEALAELRPVEQVALVGDVQTESQRLFTRAEAKEDLMWLQDLCKLTAKLLTRRQDKEAKRLSEKLDEYKTEHNILSMLQFSFDAGQNRRNDGALGGSQVDLFRNDGTSRYGRPYITATPPKQRVIFTGMSRCAYHLGRYDKALRREKPLWK